MIRSELAVRVHAALTAANIAIPVPQRDIRIRNCGPPDAARRKLGQ